jgi:hypothetical protein
LRGGSGGRVTGRWSIPKRLLILILGVLLAAAVASAPAQAQPSATRPAIVRLAAREIGYSEPGNYCTKFGPCEEWCSLFVTWVWRHAGVAVPRFPFTGNLYGWASARNAALGPRARPLPGDAVLFGTGPWSLGSSLHVGIVQAVYPHYLVTIEGDSAHAVRRYVVPLRNPLLAGEPGPIYGYASPFGRPRVPGPPLSPGTLTGGVATAVALVAATAHAIGQAPMTNARLRHAAALEGGRLRMTIQDLAAFQHMPFHNAYLGVDWTGLDAAGRVLVQVRARLPLPYAVLAWQRFLRRFHDPGVRYRASFSTVPGVPVAFSAPAVTGRPRQGSVLTVVHANWAGSPIGFRDQWESCDRHGRACTAISGATAAVHVLTAADVGHRLRVVEVAVNGLGSGAAVTSRPTPVVTALPKPKPKAKPIAKPDATAMPKPRAKTTTKPKPQPTPTPGSTTPSATAPPPTPTSQTPRATT